MNEYKYMMGTRAYHKMGDISRDEEDLLVVTEGPKRLPSSVDEVFGTDNSDIPEGEYYIGQWVAGFGFVHVAFPVETTRPLTEAEVKEYHGRGYQIGKMYLGEMNVRDHV